MVEFPALARLPAAAYVAGAADERPWGGWSVLDVGPGYAVKRIEVHAGRRLSLQTHAHRNEHWVVVGGLARVTNGTDTVDLGPNQTARITAGVAHRVENIGPDRLILIEVQIGQRLEEDDIVRLEDDYGRCAITGNAASTANS